jgi:hypothetical protein
MAQATDTDIREIQDLTSGFRQKIDEVKTDLNVIDTRLIVYILLAVV